MKHYENIETIQVRSGIPKTRYQEHTTPLFLTSGFVFDDAEDMRASFAEEKERDIYSRYSNPNTSEFIEKVCQLEKAEAGYAFASGMAAIFSTFSALLKSGDHIISARSVFGSTHTLFTRYFPKWNIHTSYFDCDHPEEISTLIQPSTRILYVETPTNPGVDILDLEKLSALASAHGLLFIVDNCFASPYLQQPIAFGADLVIHSATKLMDGQGRVLGGVTVGKEKLVKEIYTFARNTGPSLSPFNAWTLSKSLETLSVRVDRHCDNALTVAQFLETHSQVRQVKYPFLKSHPGYEIAKKQMKKGGNIIAFEIQGGLQAGQKFLNALRMCSLSANLGDTRTIVTHPASSTHSKLTKADRLKVGITDGLIRISVGLEHANDIVADLDQALLTLKK